MGGNRLILVGAGLAATLIAQRLSQRAAPPEILIVEARSAPFGDHTWSFHLSDVHPPDLDWIAPLVDRLWSGYSVRFPAYERQLESPYASLTGTSVAYQIERLPNVSIAAGRRVKYLKPDGVELDDGRRLDAACVIDARGFEPHPSLALGWQKFVGLEVETGVPHGVAEPVLMDACVDQTEGYRFVYLLPYSPTRLLIEDTVYADDRRLHDETFEDRIVGYALGRGWKLWRILRRERGVLPIALAFDAARFWSVSPPAIPRVGLRAALFHPTTGYSFAEAVRTANLIHAMWPTGSAALARALRAHALERAAEQRFYRLLSRMLFRAASAPERYRVLERFYRLPLPLIERFYAGRSTTLDKLWCLSGRPPVPFGRALSCLNESRELSVSREHSGALT